MQVSYINLTINSACEFVCIDTYLIIVSYCVCVCVCACVRACVGACVGGWVFVREYVRMAWGLTEFPMCPTGMLLSVSVCGT